VAFPNRRSTPPNISCAKATPTGCAKPKKRKPCKSGIRFYLECRSDNGGDSIFYPIDKILVLPELQERCLEKRLGRILRLIEQDPTVAKQLGEACQQ
jgi:hypothetical protein